MESIFCEIRAGWKTINEAQLQGGNFYSSAVGERWKILSTWIPFEISDMPIHVVACGGGVGAMAEADIE